MDVDKLYSVEDAATFLGGLSKWTVYAWIAKKKLRPTKVGRRTMLRQSELQRFIDTCNPDVPEEILEAGSRKSVGAR